MSEEYVYAIARIRSAELRLLTSSVLESLLAAKSYDECLRLLSDHGWDIGESMSLSTILKNERDKTWKFISELISDPHVFDVFLYANDYHNLKAAVKSAAEQVNRDDVYLEKDQCSIDPEIIRKALQQRDFSTLPADMQKVATESLDTHYRQGCTY